jgi:hypothetical protein
MRDDGEWGFRREPCHPDQIISLSSGLKNLQKLIIELSQPTRTFNQVGKMLVDKMPDSAKSPNLADAVMIRFCVGHRPMKINVDAMRAMGIRV